MGGKALKLPPIPRTKYEAMLRELKLLMPWLYFPTALVKSEHGDIDVLYTYASAIAVAEKVLVSKNKKVNGSVTSLEWRGHQVDFIKCDPEWVEFAKHWYSFGDRARVLGRAYKHYGLSLKFTGLWYADKLITRNWYCAMDYLGFGRLADSPIHFMSLAESPYVSQEIYPEFFNLREKVSWHRKLNFWFIKIGWKLW